MRLQEVRQLQERIGINGRFQALANQLAIYLQTPKVDDSVDVLQQIRGCWKRLPLSVWREAVGSFVFLGFKISIDTTNTSVLATNGAGFDAFGYQGTPALPANARMMLVSSLGKNLPIASGMPSASDFAALWDVSPGTVPSSGAWAGWTGDPEDVKIHRVNLSPLFVKLVLTTYLSATNGQYTIDSSPMNSVPYTNGFAAYFLKGTGLRLYCGSPDSTLNSSQILNEDSSFVYEGGAWKNFLQGRVISSLGNVGGIVAAFLSATPNTNAQYALTNYQQILVARTFTQYMSNYNVWAEGNFANNTLKTLLKSVQVNMMDAVHGLYQAGGGANDCYPTNGVP